MRILKFTSLIVIFLMSAPMCFASVETLLNTFNETAKESNCQTKSYGSTFENIKTAFNSSGGLEVSYDVSTDNADNLIYYWFDADTQNMGFNKTRTALANKCTYTITFPKTQLDNMTDGIHKITVVNESNNKKLEGSFSLPHLNSLIIPLGGYSTIPINSSSTTIKIPTGSSTKTIDPSTFPKSYYDISSILDNDNSSSGGGSTGSSGSGSSSGGTSGSTISGTSGSTGSGTSSSQTSSGSSSTQSSTSSSTSSSSSTTDENTTAPKTGDIISCSREADVLYYKDDKPFYDRLIVHCSLTQYAQIDAAIYNSSYDPKAEDNSANLVSTVAFQEIKKPGGFLLGWDGYDEYDRVSPLEEYNFVVEARKAPGYQPDISIQNFEIVNVPEVVEEENLHSAADETWGDEDLDGGEAVVSDNNEGDLSTAVDGGENNVDTEAAKVEQNLPEREASKCPGVFYPHDIEKSVYKAIIKKAYDECLVQGYEDGSFRPNSSLTRPEAVKIIVLATGNLAVKGCYDADCGTPFVDLDMWMGPWVRSAWDMKMVQGIAPDRFGTGTLTNAESAALVTKAFKFAQHQGCYTPNCGAGHPDSFFSDIIHMWQGPYLRALWDKQVISVGTDGKFYPDSPITRARFLEMALKARSFGQSSVIDS